MPTKTNTPAPHTIHTSYIIIGPQLPSPSPSPAAART